jgi:hypothetical protein
LFLYAFSVVSLVVLAMLSVLRHSYKEKRNIKAGVLTSLFILAFIVGASIIIGASLGSVSAGIIAFIVGYFTRLTMEGLVL